MKSICIKCGGIKSAPGQECDECGFDPSGDSDSMAKGIYLSTDRIATLEDHSQSDIEQYSKLLDEFAHQIREGESIVFDQTELARLRELYEAVASVTGWQAAHALFAFFRPAIIWLAVLGGLFALVRVLKS